MKSHIAFLILCFAMVGKISSQCDTTIVLQPDHTDGKDAFIYTLSVNQNFGHHVDFAAIAWTNNGTPVKVRGLIKFDLSSIEPGAVVHSAILSLYSYNSPFNGLHSALSGSNASVLRRITSEWDENTVTWANQPSSTIENRVFLEASSDIPAPNYTEIDVTNLIQDMIDSPTGNHGFLYKLVNENHYRRMIFASSDHPNPILHPKLEVCFSNLISSSDDLGSQHLNFQIYPNPTRGFIKLNYTEKLGAETHFQLISLQGKILLEIKDIKPGVEIDLSGLSNGMYYMSFFQGGEKVTRKILLQ